VVQAQREPLAARRDEVGREAALRQVEHEPELLQPDLAAAGVAQHAAPFVEDELWRASASMQRSRALVGENLRSARAAAFSKAAS
jgi:hypothetical protein